MGRNRALLTHHFGLLKPAIRGSWDVLDRTVALLCTFATVLAYFNPVWGRWIVVHALEGKWVWTGFSRWWALAPLVALYLWRILDANYEHVSNLSKIAAAARSELERLYTPLLVLNIGQTGSRDTQYGALVIVSLRVTNLGADTSVISWRLRHSWKGEWRDLKIVHPAGKHYQVVPGVEIDRSDFIVDKVANSLKRG